MQTLSTIAEFERVHNQLLMRAHANLLWAVANVGLISYPAPPLPHPPPHPLPAKAQSSPRLSSAPPSQLSGGIGRKDVVITNCTCSLSLGISCSAPWGVKVGCTDLGNPGKLPGTVQLANLRNAECWRMEGDIHGRRATFGRAVTVAAENNVCKAIPNFVR